MFVFMKKTYWTIMKKMLTTCLSYCLKPHLSTWYSSRNTFFSKLHSMYLKWNDILNDHSTYTLKMLILGSPFTAFSVFWSLSLVEDHWCYFCQDPPNTMMCQTYNYNQWTWFFFKGGSKPWCGIVAATRCNLSHLRPGIKRKRV